MNHPMKISMNTDDELNIFAVVEAGRLEWQAVMLMKSILMFWGDGNYKLYVIKPRKGSDLKRSTLSFFHTHSITFIDEDLNTHWSFHPLSNKVFAGKKMEEIVDGPLLFLDSDILLLNPLLYFTDISRKDIIHLKPAHNDFVAAQNYDDDFWNSLFMLFNISKQCLWFNSASASSNSHIAYYNSGVIHSHSSSKLYTKWAMMYETLLTSYTHHDLISTASKFLELPGYHQKTLFQKQVYHIGQILLSLCLQKYFSQDSVVEIPITYNYPLPLHNTLGSKQIKRLEDIFLLHYHRELRSPLWFTSFEYEDEYMKKILQILHSD